MLETCQSTETKTGDLMRFGTFSDEYGLFEVNIFPDVLRELEDSLDLYGPYIISGKVTEQYGCYSIAARSIELEQARKREVLAKAAS